MTYSAHVSREQPTCLAFLLDQSTSMAMRILEDTTKARFLADVVNKTILALSINCTKADGIRDYFHLALIGYSSSHARNALPSAVQLFHPISYVAQNPLRVEQRVRRLECAGGTKDWTVKFPVWLEPKSKGNTSMCAAFSLVIPELRLWCSVHRRSYPPTILHVTDGHPTDGDPEPLARELGGIGTDDGPCLLFTLHLDIGRGAPVLYPDDEAALPDRYARRLFRMSTALPRHAQQICQSRGLTVSQQSRGFIFNGDASSVVDFFDIGTRAATVLADR